MERDELCAAKVAAAAKLRQRRHRGERPRAPIPEEPVIAAPAICGDQGSPAEEVDTVPAPVLAASVQLTAAEQATVALLGQTSCKQAMQASLLSRFNNPADTIAQADSDMALTYGEADLITFIAALRHCVEVGWLADGAASGTFVDLGSGRGNLVLLAASTGMFDLCHGIEYVPSLHAMALEQADKWSERVGSQCELSFSCGDFGSAQTEWPTNATVIFVSLTVFGEALRQELVRVLERRVAGGALVLCFGGQISSMMYEAVGSYTIGSSWGSDTIHAYRSKHCNWDGDLPTNKAEANDQLKCERPSGSVVLPTQCAPQSNCADNSSDDEETYCEQLNAPIDCSDDSSEEEDTYREQLNDIVSGELVQEHSVPDAEDGLQLTAAEQATVAGVGVVLW